MGHFAERGGWWVMGQMLLLLLIFITGIFFRNQWHNLSTTVIGASLVILSALLGIPGVRALGRNLTAFPRPSGSTQLVQHGIYGVVRHPLYTSVICLGFGWALVWQSWPALALAGLLALWLIAKASVEERALVQRFPEYLDYKRRVKGFIPFIY